MPFSIFVMKVSSCALIIKLLFLNLQKDIEKAVLAKFQSLKDWQKRLTCSRIYKAENLDI